MGRYFNDNLSTEDYDDYDAYLEHFGIPKIKWDPQVRSRYDQLHNKTRNAMRKAGQNIANNQTIQEFRSKAKSGYKSISDGTKRFGSQASKQLNKTGNYFTKRKVRSVKRTSTGIETHKTTDFENDLEKRLHKVKKGFARFRRSLKKQFSSSVPKGSKRAGGNIYYR